MTRWTRRLAAAVLLGLLALVGLSGVGWAADPFNPCQNPPEPAMPRTGAAGLVTSDRASDTIPDRAPDPFTDPTVEIAEVYGWSWRFDTYDLGCGVDLISDAGWASNNHTANLVYSIDAAGLAILDALETMAGGRTLDWLTAMAGTIAGTLAPLIGGVWLPITIALLGVWVVWQARRSRYSDALGSLLLAFAAVGVSAVAFTAPDALAKLADQSVLTVQTTTANTITRSGSSTDLIVRESLYRSWLVGQFGNDGATARKYGPRLFAATHYTWSDVKTMRQDTTAPARLREAKQKDFTALAGELATEDPAAYSAFRGRTDRVGPAVLAWAVGIATGLYVWTCLAMILLCRILMQALAVTIPLMAVLGILPTGWGFLQSAWDRFTAALIGVAKFTLASGIMTIVLGAVMGAPISTPEKLLWIVLLSIVGFVVTKPFHNRLLRSVFATAVDDGIMARNPCRIRGAAVEKPAERPVLSLEEVRRLADAIEPRYRLMVLLAVFGSLRWGELLGLQKSDFDLSASTVRVSRAVSELGSKLTIKEPKTAAGRRTIGLPASLVPVIEDHFTRHAERGQGGRVFVGPYGATPLRANFSRVWKRALDGAELEGVHFHDLRHTGNHLAAITGASTRELMGRMGHASVDVALIYQHRTGDRDRAIAEGIEALAEAQLGTHWARIGHGGPHADSDPKSAQVRNAD